MRPRSRTFVARGLEPLIAPPTTTVRRGSPILPPHGNRSDGCTRASGLQKPSSIALLAPDSHRRHVCRCYAGTWLVSPRCTYHCRLGFARFRKGWRSLQGLNL